MTAQYSSSRDLKYRVDVPHSGGWVFGQDQRFKWCEKNCQDDYRGAMFRRDQTVWHFKSQKDALMFAMRWL